MNANESLRILAWAAYEQGWRDACSDDRSKRENSLDVLRHLDPNDLLGLQGEHR